MADELGGPNGANKRYHQVRFILDGDGNQRSDLFIFRAGERFNSNQCGLIMDRIHTLICLFLFSAVALVSTKSGLTQPFTANAPDKVMPKASAGSSLVAPGIYWTGDYPPVSDSFVITNSPLNPGTVTAYNFYTNASSSGPFILALSTNVNYSGCGPQNGAAWACAMDWWAEGTVTIGGVESPKSAPAVSFD